MRIQAAAAPQGRMGGGQDFNEMALSILWGGGTAVYGQLIARDEG